MPGFVPLTRAKSLSVADGLPAVYHKRSDSVIVADIHLGFEDAMAEVGVYLPRIQLRKAVETVRRVIEEARPKRLVIAGDLKHTFEKLTRQERVEAVKFVREIQEAGVKEIVLVRGNHDTFISGLLKKIGVDVVDEYLDLGGGVTVTHGHKSVECSCEVIVMGHEHPAVQVDVGGARVKLALLLEIPLDDGKLAVVLPALGAYQTGNPVTMDRRQYLSPIIRGHALLEEAVPWVIEEEAGSVQLSRLDALLEAASP